MGIGGKIFYDKTTGDVIFHIPEQRNSFGITQTTIEQDIATWKQLSDRNRETFDYIQLEYGQYAQDFIDSKGNYRVNLETKTLEFSYPDPNQEEPQEPVYQAPLSEKVVELETRTTATEDAILTLLTTI